MLKYYIILYITDLLYTGIYMCFVAASRNYKSIGILSAFDRYMVETTRIKLDKEWIKRRRAKRKPHRFKLFCAPIRMSLALNRLRLKARAIAYSILYY